MQGLARAHTVRLYIDVSELPLGGYKAAIQDSWEELKLYAMGSHIFSLSDMPAVALCIFFLVIWITTPRQPNEPRDALQNAELQWSRLGTTVDSYLDIVNWHQHKRGHHG